MVWVSQMLTSVFYYSANQQQENCLQQCHSEEFCQSSLNNMYKASTRNEGPSSCLCCCLLLTHSVCWALPTAWLHPDTPARAALLQNSFLWQQNTLRWHQIFISTAAAQRSACERSCTSGTKGWIFIPEVVHRAWTLAHLSASSGWDGICKLGEKCVSKLTLRTELIMGYSDLAPSTWSQHSF